MNIRHLLLLLLPAVLLSCEEPYTNLVIPPPTSPTDPVKPTEPVTPTEPEKPGTKSSGPVVVAYVTSWGNTLPDPTYLTHICYAFGKVGSDFETLEVSSPSRLARVVNLKVAAPDLKVLLSVGGWGAGNFSEMAADEKHRQKFCQNCLAAVNRYGLDGIDLDWEYPTSGSAGISYAAEDTKNFTLLVKDLRVALGKDKLITMASSSSAKYVKFPDFIDYMDWVNLMTYDMGNPPQHNSALYASGMTRRSCDESVTLHYRAGVPYDKMTLGMAFYGRDDNRSFTADDPGDNFIYYKDISTAGFNECWDATAKVPYLTDASGQMVLSYDNELSIGLKADYVKEKGLLGAMYWAADGDDADWTLSRAVSSRLLGTGASTEPSAGTPSYLVTNAYVQKYLEEVSYPNVSVSNPGTTRVKGYPGGGPGEADIPPVVTISWEPDPAAGKLTLQLWEGKWSRSYSLPSGSKQQEVTNLVPGVTYQYLVSASSGAVVARGSFSTTGLLHQVYYAPNVRNGRDLGGWKGLDGKTVAYRKIYRGGRIDGRYASATGRAEMLADGIRAELDLREASDVPSSSPLGSSVAFCAPGFDSGYNGMLRDRKPGVKEAFTFLVKCVREGKPVFFHCAAGRDRTGTMAMLVLGVLGVSLGDIAKDYELTYFSPADWSMYQGEYQHTLDNYTFPSAYKRIWEDGAAGTTFQERTENYLLKIGVPQQDIDDLKALMLE